MQLPDWLHAQTVKDYCDDIRALVQPVGEFRFLTVLDIPVAGDLYRLHAYNAAIMAHADSGRRYDNNEAVAAAETCLWVSSNWSAIDEELAENIALKNIDVGDMLTRCEMIRIIDGRAVPLIDEGELDETLKKIDDRQEQLRGSDTRLRNLL